MLLIPLVAFLLPAASARPAVPIADPAGDAVILLPDSTPEPVLLAAEDFRADARAATGRELTTTTAVPFRAPAVILPGIPGRSRILDDLARRRNLDLSHLRGEFEAYSVIPVTDPFPGVAQALVIAGGDERGVVFGLYEASERLFGTDPQVLWTDHRPARIPAAGWSAPTVVCPSPAFRYRGFFVNDEDQLGGWKGDTPKNALDDATYDRLIQTILRLRGNMMAPLVGAAPFTPAQQRLARARGILVAGTTGFESLRGTSELLWPVYALRRFHKPLPYSYSLHPREVEAFWTDIVRANRTHVRIWPIGMRGTSDWPFWVDDPAAPPTMEGRAELISRIIRRQRAILDREVGPDPDRAFIFTMRDEGLDLYRTGKLELPRNTILVWDDWAKIGRVRELPTPREAANPGGNGLYYHLTASQGQWVQYISPAVVGGELARAYRAGASRYVLFNVGDLREFPLSVAAAMDAARRTPEWMADPAAPAAFTRRWCSLHFGDAAASEAAELYDRLMELENRCRSTSVVEAVAPWVTTRPLYEVWDSASVHTLIDETSTPAFLGVYSHLLNLQRLPQRMWPVSRQYLQALRPEWDALHARAVSLALRMPESGRRFFSDNLILQTQTARQVNAWALAVFDAFEQAGRAEYAEAARNFRRAAAAMDAIVAARAEACHGEWKHWFRGETENLWGRSLWTLKPEWHAADALACAALSGRCAGSGDSQDTATLQVLPALPDAFDVSRNLCPLFAPVATLPATYKPASAKQAWVCGVLLDCPADTKPTFRIGKSVTTLAPTGPSRRRIFRVPVDPADLRAGDNPLQFTAEGPAENATLGFGVANLIVVVK